MLWSTPCDWLFGTLKPAQLNFLSILVFQLWTGACFRFDWKVVPRLVDIYKIVHISCHSHCKPADVLLDMCDQAKCEEGLSEVI